VGAAVGVVPLEARGTLPLVELHGEPMFLHPVRALLRSGVVDRVVVTADDPAAVAPFVERRRLHVEVVAAAAFWSAAARTVVLADPLCPLLPSGFVARLLADRPRDAVVAGYRPVTDTVKTVVDQQIVGTIDRDTLAIVASPVVLPGHAFAGEAPPVHDFALLATWLRKRGDLELRKAPSMARRVGDESALRVLECLDELGRRVQEA
jgi:hypothetical protein